MNNLLKIIAILLIVSVSGDNLRGANESNRDLNTFTELHDGKFFECDNDCINTDKRCDTCNRKGKTLDCDGGTHRCRNRCCNETGVTNKENKVLGHELDASAGTFLVLHEGDSFECTTDCVARNPRHKCDGCTVDSGNKFAVYCEGYGSALPTSCRNRCCNLTSSNTKTTVGYTFVNDDHTFRIKHEGIKYDCDKICFEQNNKCNKCDVDTEPPHKVRCDGGTASHGCLNKCCEEV